ncbi:hypothetical protein [Paraburkholderia caribensis]|uniref:hypothetical protein n=1 Tax=Paraburkholderia caribensis TaxID=75105 RepID=UPI0034D22B27
MADLRLYFNPVRNVITATFTPDCREITKAEVAALVAQGAEVDQSARDLNVMLKGAEQSQ